MPLLVTAKVTDPAGAVPDAGVTLHSVRLTGIDPAAGAGAEAADGDELADPQPAAD